MNWLNRSNVDTHGLRWAFDLQYARHIKAGWSDAAAFAFSCNAIFGRYTGTCQPTLKGN